MLNTAAGSMWEVSRTTNMYDPYPRLRVRLTSAQVHLPGSPEMRRCRNPFSSVHAFAGSYGFVEPPRLLEVLRTFHSYPLNWSVLAASGSAPLATATATTPRPSVGSASIVAGGTYPGSTRRAA